ncbi:MAG: N-acetylmuramoyl-L-alanine amidase [Oscillochloridaceae bacterium]|nr:N-acetylmuramoyl-L-alanine amidase [Chloroflexaceae bacterium]MDW8389184.1 N-acetylmuramoyl-L-alanine amidase [Oscillochloridaceae bacterium]
MSKRLNRRPVAPLLVPALTLLLSACIAARAAPPPPTMPAPSPTARATIARSLAAPTGGSSPTPAPAPETSTTAPLATPTPRPPGTPPRVGLQAGHLRADELPEELARLRTSTGARWGDVTEAELNLAIANRVRALLEAQGVVVDILPATVPPGYDADAFIAIHADGSGNSAARGWKLATPWRASAASRALMQAVAASYGPATGLPEDGGGVTFNMKGYYAFSYRRYQHAIARTTPAIIIEMGFMTSAADRAVLFGQPERVARGIAEGVLAYLRQRNPNDGAALLPPEYPVMRAVATGALVRAAPRNDARVLLRAGEGARIVPFDKLDGYYQAFVRAGDARVVGWVREDELIATNEQPIFPTPTNP